MNRFQTLPFARAIVVTCALLTVPQIADAKADPLSPTLLPTGQYITPPAIPGLLKNSI